MTDVSTAPTVHRCIETYVDYRGGRNIVPRGQLTEHVPEGREHFYEPIVPGAIEDMTRAPGARRSTAIPRHRADEGGHAERDAEDVAEDQAPRALHACDHPDCTFTTANRGALAGHRRSHE